MNQTWQNKLSRETIKFEEISGIRIPAGYYSWIEDFIQQTLTSDRQRVVEEIEGMKKKNVSKYICETKAQARNGGYNQALTDIIKILNKQ